MFRPRTKFRLSVIHRYGAAVVGVGAASALRFLLTPYVGNRLPFLLYFFAVIPVAWHLGVGPSLVAICLAAIITSIYFIPPFNEVGVTFVTDLIGLCLFVAVNLVIIWFAEANRIARRRLELEVAERVRAETTILAQIHQAEFARDIGLALTSNPSLTTLLDRCVAITRRHLGGTQGLIVLMDESGQPIGPFPGDGIDLNHNLIDRLAAHRDPWFTNILRDDLVASEPLWATSESMMAIASCPLVVEDRLIGIWALLSRTPLRENTLILMESVSSALALGIDRKRAEENLQLEEARKTAILETSLDAIVTMNHFGQVIEFNPAAERIFGIKAAKIRGQDLAEMLMPVQYRMPHRRGLAHYLATGEGAILNRRIELQALRADGSEFPAEIAVARIPIAGSPMFTAHIRDISDRKQTEVALQAAKLDAEEASQAKDRFIAILSHELRTPLNPISLTINSILNKTEENNELRHDLELIRHYVGLEARLIDDLLDVMRIARGKLPLCVEQTDTHRLIEQAVAICDAELGVKSLQLTLDLKAERHHIQGDPNRMRQVFWNLIKNAVKFTPVGGHIVIRSRNEPMGVPSVSQIKSMNTPISFSREIISESVKTAPNSVLVIEVIDDGVGIEADVLPRIFEAFHQGDAGITRQFGGLGLGLAICSGVVEGHGGSLTAWSAGVKHGSIFTVRLTALQELSDSSKIDSNNSLGPFSKPFAFHTHSGEAQPISLLPSEEGNFKSLRVLVVEDEPATIRLMVRLLRGLGYEVKTAESIAEATIWVEGSEHFDLIISDIGLPDGTGFDLMRRVRANGGIVPGIALTGYGTDEDVEQSRLAGFSAHMTKPIDFGHLETLIRMIVP